MNNGHTYQTVLIGKNLDEVKEKLYEKLRKEELFSHFILKDNKSVQFIVIPDNLSVIEIELLSSECVIEFNELTDLSEEDLSLVLSKVNNDFIIGISLLHSESVFIQAIVNALPEKRKHVVSNIMKLELGKIKMTDVLQAQNEILDVVEELHDNGGIQVKAKDDEV